LNSTHLGIQVFWIYLVGVVCAVFHFANGLWNLAYHWGLTVSPRSQRLWGLACGIIGVTLLAVALASLRAFINVPA
jgi:succinate dehydrogenase / fumarate reductase cytochrome b subunit